MKLQKPECTVIRFEDEDIVRTSGCPKNNTTQEISVDD